MVLLIIIKLIRLFVLFLELDEKFIFFFFNRLVNYNRLKILFFDLVFVEKNW